MDLVKAKKKQALCLEIYINLMNTKAALQYLRGHTHRHLRSYKINNLSYN